MGYRNRIKQIRVALDMSQKDLSRATGINQSQLSLIEAGQRDLRVAQLLLICHALGLTPAQFFAGIDTSAADLTAHLTAHDLVLAETPDGAVRPFTVAVARGRTFLLPVGEGDPIDPNHARIISVTAIGIDDAQ